MPVVAAGGKAIQSLRLRVHSGLRQSGRKAFCLRRTRGVAPGWHMSRRWRLRVGWGPASRGCV